MPITSVLHAPCVTQAAVDAIKFTVDQQALRRKSDADAAEKNRADMLCSINNREACEACGS